MANAKRARLALGAAALLAWIVMPIALAGAGPLASSSVTTKSLKKKLTKLTARVEALEAGQGGARPPSGPAGGDLSGSYPSPTIAGGAVGFGELQSSAVGASGRVSASGTLTRSKNVAGVTHPFTGEYCITPAAGIGVASSVMLVAPDSSDNGTLVGTDNVAHVEWRSGALDCPAGTFEVLTFLYDGDSTDNVVGAADLPGDDLAVDDESFSFWIR